ncbi:hypothetical protein [Terrabacter carboxydivorans]|uniref:Uncharacterized protein n=1 Tax=Terrabacter carboxydivorans TaxID=619730 RepID=A0ABP5Y338_9MICO
MSILRERASSLTSSPASSLISFRATSLPALVASLAATVVVLLGTLTSSVTDASAGQVLLTAAAVGVLTAVLASTGQHVVRPLPARANPSGVSGAVPASTAYWCALDAPSCPQRPRAPGRH